MSARAKKSISFFLFLFLLSAPTAHASDSQSVSIDLYHQVYTGSLKMSNGNIGDAVFCSEGNIDDPFTISGTWKNDSFNGQCMIQYDSGIQETVEYKNGVINGEVAAVYPDGSRCSYSVSNGIRYNRLETISNTGTLLSTDWYYKGVSLSDWKAASVMLDISAMNLSPYDLLDIPVRITGTIRELYSNTHYSYFTLEETGNNCMFYYRDPSSLNYEKAIVPQLSPGDTVTVYSIMESLFEKDLPLYPASNTDTWKTHFSSQEDYLESFIDGSRIANTNEYESVNITEEMDVPLFSVIYCEIGTFPFQISSYDAHECPNAFWKTEISLTGTVILDRFSSDKHKRRNLLLLESNSNRLYNLYLTSDIVSVDYYQGSTFSCSGYIRGGQKYLCIDKNSDLLTYVVIPSINVDDYSMVQ